MHFRFNSSEKPQRSSRLGVIFPQPNRLSVHNYSNLSHVPTSDVNLDIPRIYAIEQQQRQSFENELNVIVDFD